MDKRQHENKAIETGEPLTEMRVRSMTDAELSEAYQRIVGKRVVCYETAAGRLYQPGVSVMRAHLLKLSETKSKKNYGDD